MSHTPAPWVYCQKWQKVTTADGGQLVADIRGWGWLQKLPDGEAIQDANGYLIAAAPEMHRLILELHFYLNTKQDLPKEISDRLYAVMQGIRGGQPQSVGEAIAKARGDQV